jgi:polysaccharide biosynthesis transport protein
MKEDYAQLFREYITLFWREKIWIFIPLVCGIMISVALIFYLPKRYRSTTLILVEAQKIPQEYVQSPVSGTVEGRLSTIQQQILSRSLLHKIVEKLNLYEESSKKVASEAMIDQMRKNIEIKTVGTRNVDAFSVSFQAENPVTAMNVANELASQFIEQNLKIREQMVEGTSEFLNNELGSLKETLERQENQIGNR